jgi:hypothetical protein
MNRQDNERFVGKPRGIELSKQTELAVAVYYFRRPSKTLALWRLGRLGLSRSVRDFEDSLHTAFHVFVSRGPA